MSAKVDREAALPRHVEFQERMEKVASDWPSLSRASQTFTGVRNKWIAHFELEYDTAAKKYKPIDLPPLREIYSCIQDTVPIITESVSHLAGLFKGLDISTDQFAEIAQRCAAAFWELETAQPS